MTQQQQQQRENQVPKQQNLSNSNANLTSTNNSLPAVIVQDNGNGTTSSNSTNTRIVQVTGEQYKKIELLRKLKKSGVPEVAVKARCNVEKIDYSWVIEYDNATNSLVHIMIEGTNIVGSTKVSLNPWFGVNVDDVTLLDFYNTSKSPLATIVKLNIPAIQRRGQLDITTGTGTYIAVSILDLQDALGTFRAIQYDRNLYIDTLPTNTNETTDANTSTTIITNDNDTRNEDEINCKRRRFLQHLQLLGVRPPSVSMSSLSSSLTKSAPIQPSDIINLIPGLDELIDYLVSVSSPATTSSSNTTDQYHQADDEEDVLIYTFEQLGLLYTVGTKCLAKNIVTTGIDCIVQVVSSRYEQGKTLGGIVRRFLVTFQFVCCTMNNNFAIAEFTEYMINFEGTRPISSLPFVPLQHYISGGSDEYENVIEAARRRGKYYETISVGYHFVAYPKGTFYPRGIGSSSKNASSSFNAASRSEGRIMVDIRGSYDAGYSISTGYDAMILAIQEKNKEFLVYSRQQRATSNKSNASALSQSGGGSNTASTSSSSSSSLDGPLMMQTIPNYLLDLTWPTVSGFSFTSKLWGDVLVDSLIPIQFSEQTFEQLVLPAHSKRMIKALVRHTNDAFHDIIVGKGEGSVFLLYGPPGVGKTLTAEAISELLHRPLYTVSLGQLGTTPSELETRMGEILDLCSRWDALILLDEADIFLEKRATGGSGSGSSSSFERNAMVSIMLRLVEYFRGVLFLTSNRVESLDPAFRTRITLALRYDPLDAKAREQVWYNLLHASGQQHLIRTVSSTTESTEIIVTVNDDNGLNLQELAKAPLNGREIKNCIRLALALAAEDNTPLTQSILLETIDLINDFNEKLNNAEAY